MKYLLVLCVTVTVVLGFTPESFRRQSTAGIWEDDYDLLFDPGRIPLISGSRLYTNLSNYVTSREEQMGLNSSDFFLVGASTVFKDRFHPAGIFDGYRYETPENTGLFNPYTGSAIFGTGKVIDVDWLDPDTNGSYDYKRVRTQERNAWSYGNGYDLYLGVGIKNSTNRLGAGIAWNKSSAADIYPDMDFILHDFDSSLITGGITYRRDDTADYTHQQGFSPVRLVLSAWFDQSDGSAYGINLEPGLLSESNLTKTAFSSFTDWNPGNVGLPDFDKQTLKGESQQSYQGFQVPLSLTYSGSEANKCQNWFYVKGFFQSEGLGAGSGGYSYSNFYRTVNPGDSSGADTLLHRLRGARGSCGGSLRFRQLHRLNDRLRVGWSASLGYTSYRDSLVDSLAETHRFRFDNGDTVQTRADYRRTVTSAEYWLNRTKGQTARLELPVGLEFNPTTAIALRLGALHTVSWNQTNTVEQLLAFAPRKTRYDYGDGTFWEELDDSHRTPAGSAMANSWTQTTTFTYGIGFEPVNNLQIDLMGFADLLRLSGWRLSAVLKF